MRKVYAKPEIDTRTFAQFENVFTACDRNPSRTDCVTCGPWNPGDDVKPCDCGLANADHSRHWDVTGS